MMPEDVAEGVDRGGGYEALAAVLGRFQLHGAHADSLREHCVDIIDVPIHHDPGSALVALRAGDVLAINDPELVLVSPSRNSTYPGRSK
jgi:hypothetical protein